MLECCSQSCSRSVGYVTGEAISAILPQTGHSGRVRAQASVEGACRERHLQGRYGVFCQGIFSRIYSIELDAELYAQAKRRLAGMKHVSILQGDSARVFPRLMKEMDQPSLFWPDGHYSGDFTARGREGPSIADELAHIFCHPVEGHLILIGDARMFTGKNDYPTLEGVEEMVGEAYSSHLFEVRDDIIGTAPWVGEPNPRLS